MPRNTNSQHIFEIFLHPVFDDSPIWTCGRGVRRKRPTILYGKLVSHVHTAHPDYDSSLSSEKELTQTQVKCFFLTKTPSAYFGWYSSVMYYLLPFCAIENATTRMRVKHNRISLSTFLRHLPALPKVVESKISELLPDCFALMFNCYSFDKTHYLALFVSFRAKNTKLYSLFSSPSRRLRASLHSAMTSTYV